MSDLKAMALALIVVGVVGLIGLMYGGITIKVSSKIGEPSNLVTVKPPVWASVGAIVAGVVLIVRTKK